MWTCDFKRLQVSAPACAAGYLLDAKGKAIVFALLASTPDGAFLIGVPAHELEKTHETLDRYLIADDVAIDDETRFELAFEAVSGEPLSPLAPPVPGARDAVYAVKAEEWGWRLPRALVGGGHEELWVLRGKSEALELRELSPSKWERLRIAHGVPEWGRDVLADALILEFPYREAVSFHKGCYIGQEVVARATSRGKMNRGFARFRTADGSPLAEAFVYSEADAERPVGKVTTAVASEGLGLVRFSALSGALYQIDGGKRVAVAAETIDG
jgi:folate-binding protein YgfZ